MFPAVTQNNTTDFLLKKPVFLSPPVCRSHLAPHHVEQPYHCSQFQEAPRVFWKSQLCEQQVWVVSAPQRRERVCSVRCRSNQCAPVLFVLDVKSSKTSLLWVSLYFHFKHHIYFASILTLSLFTGWMCMKMGRPPDDVSTAPVLQPFHGWDFGPQCFSDLGISSQTRTSN